MDKEEIQNHLEEDIRDLISSIAEQIEEMMFEEAEKQLEEEIERDEFPRRMPVIRNQLEIPEEIRELEKLKANLQEADKILHDNPKTIGDEHEFIDKPYSQEPSKEELKQLSEDLEDIDRENILTCDKEEISKAKEKIDSFKKSREKA
ncbi:MAG: hypothetical protein ABEJ87_02600 [Candidatus Nanohalobium sp.]